MERKQEFIVTTSSEGKNRILENFTPEKYRQSFVCNFTEFHDGKLYFHKCPYRNKCEKYNEFDPSAMVKAWKDFSECEDFKGFALKDR